MLRMEAVHQVNVLCVVCCCTVRSHQFAFLALATTHALLCHIRIYIINSRYRIECHVGHWQHDDTQRLPASRAVGHIRGRPAEYGQCDKCPVALFHSESCRTHCHHHRACSGILCGRHVTLAHEFSIDFSSVFRVHSVSTGTVVCVMASHRQCKCARHPPRAHM